MADRRAVLLGAALVTLIMVLSAMGLLAVAAPASGAPAGALAVPSATASVVVTPSASAAGAPPSAASQVNPTATSLPLSPVAQHALAVAQADGVPSRDVFVPRAGATPSQEAVAAAQGHVSPLYTQYSPAPIGLADYGLSANPNGNGSVVPSILNSSSLLATFSPNSTGLLGAYPFSSAPDFYGVQLNAVSTSINLFGNDTYSMWTQNVVEYSPIQQELALVTNVWNFSGPSLSDNAIYAHGPYGVYVPGVLYYAEYFNNSLPYLSGVTYPFSIDLWMNNTVNATRNMVTFTVGLNDPGNPSVSGSYAYDYVVFNSTAATLSNYTANGYQYNAFGLTNDFEVIMGGPGGGSNANLFDADANLTLQYWNATAAAYESVPSAFSYGGETGETVTGANVGWVNSSIGSPVGVVTTGPGILEGLWNATGPAGLDEVDLAITPTNAFYFIGPNWTSNFSYQGDPYWAPQELTDGIFWLAPGDYNLSILLADYEPVYTSFDLTGTGVTITMALTPDAALGIYAPLYFWENSQFGPLSTRGSGTPTDPYQIVNTQVADFPTIFGLFNDYTFPIFTGVFIWGTTASVVLNDMPALVSGSPYIYFPATKDLGYTFYYASNIALTNSTAISGWFTTNTLSGIGSGFNGNYYGTFSVMEWNSSDVLIAGNWFHVQTGGIYMANGVNNTVWGNTFIETANPTFAACSLASPVCALNQSLGLELAEQGALVYNNVFDTNTTASAPPFNLYTGTLDFWTDLWNITPAPASAINHAVGWPDFALSGSIIGNATQGGNFWWDYGQANNPYGVLPYDEYQGGQTQIYDGGDSYPLIYGYAVTFTESGLSTGTAWSVTIDSGLYSSTTSTIVVGFVNGSYTYTVNAVSGYTPSSGSGPFTVAGVATGVSVTFTPISTPTYAVTFTESGLIAGTSWTVSVDGTPQTQSTASIVFDEPNATSYSYAVDTVTGYSAPSPPSGTFGVAGLPVFESITFTPVAATYTVSFTETGLPSGTNWTVTLDSTLHYSTTATVSFASLANATYTYTIGSVTGYTSNLTTSTLQVAGSDVKEFVGFTAVTPSTYSITFTESGLPSGTSWSVTVSGIPTQSSTGTTITFTGLANGLYPFSIGAVSGYTSSTTSNEVTVSSADQSVTVTFSSTSTSTSNSGLSNLDWAIIGAVIAIIIIALLVALAMRGRSGGSGGSGPKSQASQEPGTQDSNAPMDDEAGQGNG